MSSAIAAPVAPVQTRVAEESFYRTREPLEYDDSLLALAAKQAPSQSLLMDLFLHSQEIGISSYPGSNTQTLGCNSDIVRQGEVRGFGIAFSRIQLLPKGAYDGAASLVSLVALGCMAALTKSILPISTIRREHPAIDEKCGTALLIVRWAIDKVR